MSLMVRDGASRLLTMRSQSITLHPGQLVGVKIAVAEQLLADPRALHEEADIELVGHAHAAMHLHALLNRQRRGRTGARFFDRARRARIFQNRIERLPP